MVHCRRHDPYDDAPPWHIHPVHDDVVFFPPVDMRLAFSDEACAAIVDDAERACMEARDTLRLLEISADIFGLGPLAERD